MAGHGITGATTTTTTTARAAARGHEHGTVTTTMRMPICVRPSSRTALHHTWSNDETNYNLAVTRMVTRI